MVRRVDSDIRSINNKNIAASDRFMIVSERRVPTTLNESLKKSSLKVRAANLSQAGKASSSDLLVDWQEFDHAMAAFTQSAQMMSDHVVASITPLCSISAMGDRIDRLNRENAEALDKLINGRL